LIKERARAGGLTVSAYIRRAALGRRTRRRRAYLDRLTLHELSVLAVLLDTLAQELSSKNVAVPKSVGTVRELLQTHIDALTNDDYSC
jgi:hypothetical protein